MRVRIETALLFAYYNCNVYLVKLPDFKLTVTLVAPMVHVSRDGIIRLLQYFRAGCTPKASPGPKDHWSGNTEMTWQDIAEVVNVEALPAVLFATCCHTFVLVDDTIACCRRASLTGTKFVSPSFAPTGISRTMFHCGLESSADLDPFE